MVHGGHAAASGAVAVGTDNSNMSFVQLSKEIDTLKDTISAVGPNSAATPALQARLNELNQQLSVKMAAHDYS